MPHKDPLAAAACKKAYRLVNLEKTKADQAAWRLRNREKVLADKKADWLKNHEANKARLRERYKADPEKYKQLGKEQYAKRQDANQTYAAEYRAANKQQVVESKKRYAIENRGKINTLVAKRKAAKLQRTPAWQSEDDLWMIEQAHELAALRTRLFGFPWHVDHVLPLQGKRVSGLHTPYNMQVIPGAENIRKGNRF
jgi:hypothetical protein